MKLTEHTPYPEAGYLSHIEIDKATLAKIGVNENINVFVPSPSVPIAFIGDIKIASIISDAWHGHFKHLILAMPALIEAAAKVCEEEHKLDEYVHQKIFSDAIQSLKDALQPYKNAL